MTEMDQAVAPESPLAHRDDPTLDVGFTDVLLALFTFATSLAVLVYGFSPIATLPIVVLLHLAMLIAPALFLRTRARHDGDLALPALLLVATFAAGPVGALGCAVMALALWRRHPSPRRLRDWYDYIAGVVARSRVTRIYDELVSGRLPSDPEAKVLRFGLILQGASIEDQQRVLGVISRRYHADFRFTLSSAMRNRNGFIRAQAAAVASCLSSDEKSRLWSAAIAREDGRERPHEPTDARMPALAAQPRRP